MAATHTVEAFTRHARVNAKLTTRACMPFGTHVRKQLASPTCPILQVHACLVDTGGQKLCPPSTPEHSQLRGANGPQPILMESKLK